MDRAFNYESQLRDKITCLRLQKNISEHRMSLDLGKSGAYIRSITSGTSLPSVRELFNIIQYFDMTPAEFFRDFGDSSSALSKLNEQLRQMCDSDLEKVTLFLSWINK